MRTTRKKEARRKRNNLIIGLVLVVLMMFSIIAFSISPTNQIQNTFEYNNYTFTQRVVFDENIFMQEIVRHTTEIQGQEIMFYFAPGTMGQVNDNTTNLDNIKNVNTLTFTREPLTEETEYDINMFFFDVIRYEFSMNTFKNTQMGLTSHSLFESDTPIITCDEATQDNYVIKLSKEVGTPRINEIEPYCFEIIGNGDNLLYISDYLIYKSHGVI